MVLIKDLCELIGNSERAGPLSFEKEDREIMRRFGLQNLKDSYSKDRLVPEEISKAVGQALKYIRSSKLGNYLQDSPLGRKIQGVVDHDTRVVHQIGRPVYEAFKKVNPNGSLKANKWKPKVKSALLKGKSEKQVEELENLTKDCVTRLHRYVSNELPREWG